MVVKHLAYAGAVARCEDSLGVVGEPSNVFDIGRTHEEGEDPRLIGILGVSVARLHAGHMRTRIAVQSSGISPSHSTPESL